LDQGGKVGLLLMANFRPKFLNGLQRKHTAIELRGIPRVFIPIGWQRNEVPLCEHEQTPGDHLTDVVVRQFGVHPVSLLELLDVISAGTVFTQAL
jgi:hypothetical protein